MTYVQTMTDRDLNVEIAELLDYPQNRFVPNYCVDILASQELQAKAMEINYADYIEKLAEIVNPFELWTYEGIASLLLAKPRAIAEASYTILKEKHRKE